MNYGQPLTRWIIQFIHLVYIEVTISMPNLGFNWRDASARCARQHLKSPHDDVNLAVGGVIKKRFVHSRQMNSPKVIWRLSEVVNAMDVTAIVFSFMFFCFFLLQQIAHISTRHWKVYDAFTRLSLDDRLTREFTYLYMCLRDSISIKIVQFIQGFLLPLKLPSVSLNFNHFPAFFIT